MIYQKQIDEIKQKLCDDNFNNPNEIYDMLDNINPPLIADSVIVKINNEIVQHQKIIDSLTSHPDDKVAATYHEDAIETLQLVKSFAEY